MGVVTICRLQPSEISFKYSLHLRGMQKLHNPDEWDEQNNMKCRTKALLLGLMVIAATGVLFLARDMITRMEDAVEPQMVWPTQEQTGRQTIFGLAEKLSSQLSEKPAVSVLEAEVESEEAFSEKILDGVQDPKVNTSPMRPGVFTAATVLKQLRILFGVQNGQDGVSASSTQIQRQPEALSAQEYKMPKIRTLNERGETFTVDVIKELYLELLTAMINDAEAAGPVKNIPHWLLELPNQDTIITNKQTVNNALTREGPDPWWKERKAPKLKEKIDSELSIKDEVEDSVGFSGKTGGFPFHLGPSLSSQINLQEAHRHPNSPESDADGWGD